MFVSSVLHVFLLKCPCNNKYYVMCRDLLVELLFFFKCISTWSTFSKSKKEVKQQEIRIGESKIEEGIPENLNTADISSTQCSTFYLYIHKNSKLVRVDSESKSYIRTHFDLDIEKSFYFSRVKIIKVTFMIWLLINCSVLVLTTHLLSRSLKDGYLW